MVLIRHYYFGLDYKDSKENKILEINMLTEMQSITDKILNHMGG